MYTFHCFNPFIHHLHFIMLFSFKWTPKLWSLPTFPSTGRLEAEGWSVSQRRRRQIMRCGSWRTIRWKVPGRFHRFKQTNFQGYDYIYLVYFLGLYFQQLISSSPSPSPPPPPPSSFFFFFQQYLFNV